MLLHRLLLLLLVLLSAPAFAADAASAQEVRAALLFNFMKFTDWPDTEEKAPSFQICIASRDTAQSAAIEALAGRRVRNKHLVVLPFSREARCNVIYVDAPQRWKEIVVLPTHGQALSIGAYAGFATEGGMIEIALQDGAPRFDINNGEAKRAGFRFYPQLLRLARRVSD